MIARLRGRAVANTPDGLVLDVPASLTKDDRGVPSADGRRREGQVVLRPPADRKRLLQLVLGAVREGEPDVAGHAGQVRGLSDAVRNFFA